MIAANIQELYRMYFKCGCIKAIEPEPPRNNYHRLWINNRFVVYGPPNQKPLENWIAHARILDRTKNYWEPDSQWMKYLEENNAMDL